MMRDPQAGYSMSHIAVHKDELLKRVKRIAGQIQAVERALESDLDCAKTLHLVAATRGAINGLMEKIIEDHAREHVANPALTEEERKQGVEELLEAIRRYSK
jgi:DNA-binding FrmR family transcriptional regulator